MPESLVAELIGERIFFYLILQARLAQGGSLVLNTNADSLLRIGAPAIHGPST